MPPWIRDCPEEHSDGARPTKEPMVLPVKRFQSLIFTANANPVSAETLRRQPSRLTVEVNEESAAIFSMMLSSRSRRAMVWVTAS